MFLITIGLLACVVAACAWAQISSLEKTIGEIAAVHGFPEIAISPDGARVAWVETFESKSGIFLLNLKRNAARPRRLGDGSDLAWSPDGSHLAFVSRRRSTKQPQLYVASVAGGTSRCLTNLKGYLTRPLWSPDGRQVAVLFAENSPAGGGPLEAAPTRTGVIDKEIYNQRITIIDAASGGVRQVSPASLNVYECDWSPDGRSFAFTAAPGPGDNNWWIARLYTMPLDTGKPRAIYNPPARRQLAVPRWSPDGKNVGFIGGLMSDEGFTGGDLFTIPAQGGEPHNLTPKRKASPSWFTWISPTRLLFTETAGGGSAVNTLDLISGRVEALWAGGRNMHAAGHYPNFSVARDGVTSALVRHSWTEAPEIWAGPIGRWRPITSANTALHPRWGEARNLEWKNEGFDIQGWLIYPRPYDPALRYPMVVFVHGGPANVKKPAWPTKFFDMVPLSGEGYFVFLPNPRGSYGRGEDFVEANVKDFGGGDLRDILAGIDYIVKTLPVDSNRIGITGWSYGGFMSMWAVTQTNRFRAAVAGGGIANWQSYYGQNLIDRWMIPFFGATVYDDPAVYAKSSPINFIKQAKTPTLVLVGEYDAETPPPQSYEFWHALKVLGVETQLVVYSGEGHDFRKPTNRADALRRTLDWFNRYLK